MINRSIIAGAAVAALALVPAVASADPGWRTVATDSSVSRYGSTFGYVSSGAGDTTAARLSIRVSRAMRVRVETRLSCHDLDYTVTNDQDLPAASRIVRPSRSWVKLYGPTFPEASGCYVSTSIRGGKGRVTATLAVPA